MKAVRNKKYPKAQRGIHLRSGARTRNTSVAAQRNKGSRVERGLTVRPEDYDTTTAEGRAAYMADRRQSRENRLAQDAELNRQVQSGEITPRERYQIRKDRDVNQNREIYRRTASPDNITLDGQRNPWNRDVRAAMNRRGSETANLREDQKVVLPYGRLENRDAVIKPKGNRRGYVRRGYR